MVFLPQPQGSVWLSLIHIFKYSGATKYDVGDTSENDFPIFRTAEVFLNYVEAKAESGTLEQHDIDRTIKLIRDRAVSYTHLDVYKRQVISPILL